MNDLKPARYFFKKGGAAFLMVLSLLTGRGEAESISGSEYQVKAGFIYHFARFTQWPDQAFKLPDDPLTLCILTGDPQAKAMSVLQDKFIKNHRLTVTTYTEKEEIPQTCHILFIASSDEKIILKALKESGGPGVLTIGQADGFARMGGIINLFTKDRRLRFEVNPAAAERAGIKLSSQLLMSAEIVQEP
jgi:hypothetical protein